MSEITYYQRNKEAILNRERAKNKYRELSEEERKYKKRVWKKRYHNMSEENKKRLREYQKKYREAKKHISQMQICR